MKYQEKEEAMEERTEENLTGDELAERGLDEILGQSKPGVGHGSSYVGSGAEVGKDYEFPTGSVFLLTSKTYLTDPTDWDNVVVGVFVSRETAQSYADNAVPPVSDGVITKWGIEGAEGFAPVGRIAPFHGVV